MVNTYYTTIIQCYVCLIMFLPLQPLHQLPLSGYRDSSRTQSTWEIFPLHAIDCCHLFCAECPSSMTCTYQQLYPIFGDSYQHLNYWAWKTLKKYLTLLCYDDILWAIECIIWTIGTISMLIKTHTWRSYVSFAWQPVCIYFFCCLIREKYLVTRGGMTRSRERIGLYREVI